MFSLVSHSLLSISAFFIEFAANIRPHLKTAKLSVTGGFRSTPAMASALREGSCDSIGLGRPLTAEADLARALLEGKSLKARENLVPAHLQTPSSIIQIGEVRWTSERGCCMTGRVSADVLLAF